MSAPAITTQVPTAPVVSSAPAASTRPVASTRPAVSTALTTAVASSIAASPSLIPSTTRSSTRRHRTTTITSASSVFPTVVPFDPAEERQADSHRTNKILIGIFSGFGVILLGLVAFQFYRWYKRRYQNKGVPLPPPRMSMYKEYPKDFSRPPSMMHHNSGSGLITPSVRSNAPSMDVRVDETGRRISDPSRAPGQITREYSPDNSLTGAPLVPNDEELGRRRSPLGSRSESPSNLSPPRPPSQAQVNPRPDPRTRAAHPPSAMANQRHSSIGAPGSNRNSTHDPNRRSSFYGTPHSARERLGLVMPQPLAPEAVNYAVSSRNDSRPSSAWGSRAGSEHDHNQTLSPPKGPRPDSWVVNVHSSTASLNDSPVTSDAPSKDGTLPRGRDRASRPEIPRS